MVKRYGIGRCVLMALFTDTVTLYTKISDTEWKSTTVEGVEWSDKNERQNNDGTLDVIRYASVTFPEGTYEGLKLDAAGEEDCIVYGAVSDIVDGSRGNRTSDLLSKYSRSGKIRSVSDNSNRSFLKNKKVVVS